MWNKYSLILSINCFFFTCHCQTAEESYRMADDLFSHGQYEAAIALYERVAFFDQGRQSDCYLQIGRAQLYLGQYTNAEKQFEYGFQSATNDSSRAVIIMDKALLYILTGRYDMAQLELFSIDNAVDSMFHFRYNLLLGLSLLGQNKFEESRQHLLLIVKTGKEKNSLDSLIAVARKWEKRKPGAAFYMSLLLPGSGQLRYSYYQEAVNSFMLNGLLFTLMYMVYTEYGMLDASLSVLPWIGRYYLGGATLAEKLAIKKTAAMKEEVFYEIIKLVEESEPEAK